MIVAVIAANLVQLIIILAIFYLRGHNLGVPVMLLLFLLMPIPFINLLTLFITHRSPQLPINDADDTTGMIKREAMRVNYPDDNCPIMHIGDTAFAVRDLSEGGVRISASTAIRFKRRVHGEIQLINGDRIRIKATVMRREEGAAVFQFIDPIGTATLMQEKKVLAADNTG